MVFSAGPYKSVNAIHGINIDDPALYMIVNLFFRKHNMPLEKPFLSNI